MYHLGVIGMEALLNSPQERQRIQVYNEYLRKIPQLLQQLETVETMYQKALLEESMLPKCAPENKSSELYMQRLKSTKEQCLLRAADIRQQCQLIFTLKAQIEQESTALQVLMNQQTGPKE